MTLKTCKSRERGRRESRGGGQVRERKGRREKEEREGEENLGETDVTNVDFSNKLSGKEHLK